jgi:GNAT superfamily N-acetyltransferase
LETTYRGIYPDDKLDNYDFDKNTEKFKNIISNENVDLYVVIVDGEIIGYMSCGVPIRSYDDYEQKIGLLYLLKDYHGKGIGRALCELACEMLKMRGYDRFFVFYNKYNEVGRKFYEAIGGKLVEEDPDNDDKSIPQVKFHYDV